MTAANVRIGLGGLLILLGLVDLAFSTSGFTIIRGSLFFLVGLWQLFTGLRMRGNLPGPPSR
jgi:hypothetical protein